MSETSGESMNEVLTTTVRVTFRSGRYTEVTEAVHDREELSREIRERQNTRFLLFEGPKKTTLINIDQVETVEIFRDGDGDPR